MRGSCNRCPDTVAGRARLWADHTRSCEKCGRRLWADKDGMFTLDPRGLVCDLCVMKPYHVERNRLQRSAAGRAGWEKAERQREEQESNEAAKARQAAAAKRKASADKRREEIERVAAERHAAAEDVRLKGVWGSAYLTASERAELEAHPELLEEDEYDEYDEYDPPW